MIQDMRRETLPPRGGITEKDIDRAMKRIGLGDQIAVTVIKCCDVEATTYAKAGLRRRCVVTGKYPHFVEVQLPSGIREHILWIDLVKKKVNRGE